MSGLWRRLSLGIAVWMLIARPGVMAQATPHGTPTLADILLAAHRYVHDYEDKLTLIVADETYLQRVYASGRGWTTFPSRLLKSEVFFAFTPSKKEWLAVRDVKSVDGTTVQRGPDVGALLATLPGDEVATTLKAYNSRFNIGSTYRNFNEPTLGLLLFDTNWPEDLEFTVKRIESADDVSVATLGFRERGAPTLLTNLKGQPVLSTGEATIEVETGRLRRIVLKTPLGDSVSELETTYARDAKLDLWLPATFVENYTYYTPMGQEQVVCRATYSNFRRFEVHGGIK